MADQRIEPVKQFTPGVVLCFGGFHQEIIGMAAGLCPAGVFVKRYDRHGRLVIALVEIRYRIEEMHGYEGETGLLRAMLDLEQIEVPHLMKVIEENGDEMLMRAIFVAGSKLESDHKSFDDRLRPVLRGLNPGECRKLFAECGRKWLLRLLVEECQHLEPLNEIAQKRSRTLLPRSLRRAAERRALWFPSD
jgi:hypothetical protein